MKKKASLSVIFLTVFIDLMGFGILIPILPTFATKELGVSDFGIGLVIGIYSLTQFILNPILGKVSDKIGRRPIILATLLITASSYIMFSFATSFIYLLLSRMLAGLGGSNIGVAQAYIADITSDEERSKGMGLIGAAFGLGFVFGPMIGGFLSEYSYMYAGFGSAGFSLIAFLFALIALPESNIERKSDSRISYKIFDIPYIKEVLSKPTLGLLIILFFLIVFSMANIYGTFAILGFKVYGFTDRETGYLLGMNGIIGALMQGGLIRFLSRKFKEKNLILWGTLTMSVGLGMLPYGGSFWGVAAVIMILGVGTGLLQPVILSLVSKFSPEKQQGAVLGLNQSFASMARVLGPVWGGFSYEILGYQFPFLTGAFFTFVTFFIVIIMLRTE